MWNTLKTYVTGGVIIAAGAIAATLAVSGGRYLVQKVKG